MIPAKRTEIEVNTDFLVGQDESNAIRTNNLAGLQALPAERLLPASISVLGPRKPGCMLCEYVLHEIVNDLKNITVKEEIETVSVTKLRLENIRICRLTYSNCLIGREKHLQKVAV
jgi:hypothetical protein